MKEINKRKIAVYDAIVKSELSLMDLKCSKCPIAEACDKHGKDTCADTIHTWVKEGAE